MRPIWAIVRLQLLNLGVVKVREVYENSQDSLYHVQKITRKMQTNKTGVML